MSMPRTSVVDWESLKPEILRLLSAGKTQKDVREELSRKGSRITKSQLEYQLKCWGQRTRLTEKAWRFADHRIKKRERKSAVFFNGALIPYAKVTKEISRHVRPTMLLEPGDSPECPEGFDLVICTPASLMESPPPNGFSESQNSLTEHDVSVSSLPWMKLFRGLQGVLRSSSISLNSDMIDFTSFTLPEPSQFPGALIELCGLRKTRFGLEQLDKPCMALLGWSDDDQAVDGEVAPRRVLPFESQVAILLGLQMFQISNKLSTDRNVRNNERLQELGETVKLVAKTTSNWKSLLTARPGVTSRALIEQLFDLSIICSDEILAELMLQIGADPNQLIFNEDLRTCISALDYTILRTSRSISNLLLDAGADYDQMSLKHAVRARDIRTVDRILRSDQSLNLDFNYLDSLGRDEIPLPGRLRLEKVTLLGLICLFSCDQDCSCHGIKLTSNHSHSSDCERYASIVCLELLVQKGATIALDTMILASFSADVATLRFLIQHGGDMDGNNSFGISCIDAACLRRGTQCYSVISLILDSGATTNIARTDYAFDCRASLFHCILVGCEQRSRETCYKHDSELELVDWLICSGANMNHRVRQIGSQIELALAHERFLWSHLQSSQSTTITDLIAYSKVESPLEYAIISGCKNIALRLILLGCRFTGREITLAVRMGRMSILKALIECDGSNFDQESIRRMSFRLGLRWGHNDIVQYLLEQGVRFGEDDLRYALQFHGTLKLSTDTQVRLINATPDFEQVEIVGLSLLHLCSRKLTSGAVRYILRQFPAAYDSGALFAIVARALWGSLCDPLNMEDIQNMASRRTARNCDWEKENTALLLAASFHRRDVLRVLAPQGRNWVMKTARIPRTYMSSFFSGLSFPVLDPTHIILGFQDWVSCSPLVGIAMIRDSDWSDDQCIAEDMLDHLLACSYKPDALTVVIAVVRGSLKFLRRLARLEIWREILSIDEESRPPWCPTALQAAVLHGNEEMVGLLLEAGKSVNEAPVEEPIWTCLPRTSLQAAVDKGNLKLTNLLIERGACINAPAAEDSGATALQLACIHGYLTISLKLLALGADVNARGAKKNGRTALEGAAEHGRIDTIQLLLSHGVCTDGPYREQYLKSVLYAQKNRHFAAAALLKEHREWSAEDEECYERLQSADLANE